MEEAQSILIARMKRTNDNDDFKTALIKFFLDDDPHKTGILPIKELSFENVEKIEVKGFDVTIFLEGNDLIINNAGKVNVSHDEANAVVRVEKA